MKKILITDDDAAIVDLVKTKLARFKYEIVTARDGNEAVRECLNAPPDLVLMDIEMPNLNGIEATKELRRKGFRNPIIILTASESEEDRKEATAAGCNGYVRKSGDLSRLGGLIDMTLLHFT